jgi:hypothetical protein
MSQFDSSNLLAAQRHHLANLLEAIQRCVYFLQASDDLLPWPLSGSLLADRKKDVGLFESLAAVNERFSKLQDTLGAAMRHSLLLSGERAESFIKVLALFEKYGVIASIEDWQTARTARNLAAHDYEIDYGVVAEHFNTLHELRWGLYVSSWRFVRYCSTELDVESSSSDFSIEFERIAAVELGL